MLKEGPQTFPLEWPPGIARWRGPRERAMFRNGSNRIEIGAAVTRVFYELERLGATDPTLSSNLRPTLSGRPAANQGTPIDPGAAVYFRIDGEPRAIACDKWDRVSDNFAAIAADLEAKRGQVRWGASTRAQIFGGYRALQAMDARQPWWKILEVDEGAELAVAEAARERLLMKFHPDKPGGSHARAAEINGAFAEARLEHEERGRR